MRTARRFAPVVIALSTLFAAHYARAEGETNSMVRLGVNFHTGGTNDSITGNSGYALGFAVEKKQGIFRYTVGTELETSSGDMILIDNVTTPGTPISVPTSYKLFGAGFKGGFNFFLFPQGVVNPYLGLTGIVSWYFMSTASTTPGITPYTSSIAFGYEPTIGVDIRVTNDHAVRITTGVQTISANLAGVGSFKLDAFRMGVGFVF